MKHLALIFSILVFTCLGSTSLQAQNYKNAIGLRLGYPLSISYKHFLNEKNAFEVYAGRRGSSFYSWFNASAAYQIHNPISAVEGLEWYYGAGASVYFWNFDNTFLDDASSTSFGLQGYIGLQYTFSDTPITLSVDWVPTYFLNGYGSGFGGENGALAVRYILGRD